MNNKLPLLTLVVTLFTFLTFPVMYLVHYNENVFELETVALTTLGISFFILSTYLLLFRLNPLLAKALAVSLFLLFFLIRLMLSFVYDFSGRGFTSEFFVHFGWQSMVIAVSDYGGILLLIAIISILCIFFFIKLLNKQPTCSPFVGLILMFISISIVASNLNALPEWRLLQGYQQYNTLLIKSEDSKALRAEMRTILQPLRHTNNLPVDKEDIVANIATEQPKNIILIYLESFSEILTNHSSYPGLTPNLDKLKSEHISLNNKFTAGYVTIEGIASSQCGTLMNMNSGNNALTSSFGRLTYFPCLGDILKSAGYKQIYYGGANRNFAGKKDFLTEHGYDEVWGIKKWKQHGLTAANSWGLSDTDLFNQALERVLELKETKQPFNLTLLTLGTHLPGVSYQDCKPYTKTNTSDPFLDAIHCSDYLVGRFINQLKQHNILENTVVYIQGDHPIFPTHKMKKLFPKKYKDDRVFNLIIDNNQDTTLINEDKASSTMNLVANILESLQIKHNVDFVFAQSDFDAANLQPYLLTRFSSYHDLKEVPKTATSKNCAQTKFLSIPLDSCEKKLALNSVYRLNASYSQPKKPQEVCQLGIDISISPSSKKVSVRWGNTDLTQRFYSKGLLVPATKIGFYLILLNQYDQALSQAFYPSDDPHELNRLYKEITQEGNRYLLFTNLTTKQLQTVTAPVKIPNDFIKQKILYASYQEGKITALNNTLRLPLTKFIPNFCVRNSVAIPLFQPRW